MKRKRKSVTNQGLVNPIQPAAGAAVAKPMRVEHELPLLPVEAAPKDALDHVGGEAELHVGAGGVYDPYDPLVLLGPRGEAAVMPILM